MAFTIQDFRGKALTNSGARANLFEVEIHDVPANTLSGTAVNEFMFTCKAAAIPAMTVGTIDVPYFGRTIKVPGNKTFDNWTVTIINDEDFIVRNGFEKWIAAMGTHAKNVSTLIEDEIYGNATVKHYNKSNDKTIAEYKFVNIFPVSVSEITLGWDANDAIEEFTVEFAYDYWTHTDVIAPNASLLLFYIIN